MSEKTTWPQDVAALRVCFIELGRAAEKLASIPAGATPDDLRQVWRTLAPGSGLYSAGASGFALSELKSTWAREAETAAGRMEGLLRQVAGHLQAHDGTERRLLPTADFCNRPNTPGTAFVSATGDCLPRGIAAEGIPLVVVGYRDALPTGHILLQRMPEGSCFWLEAAETQGQRRWCFVLGPATMVGQAVYMPDSFDAEKCLSWTLSANVDKKLVRQRTLHEIAERERREKEEREKTERRLRFARMGPEGEVDYLAGLEKAVERLQKQVDAEAKK